MLFSSLINLCYDIIFPRKINTLLIDNTQLQKIRPWQYALLDYKKTEVKKLIVYLKNKDDSYLKKHIADQIYLHTKDIFQGYSRIVVIPVPTSKKRRKERGFNPTETIALYLSQKQRNIYYEKDLFEKQDFKKQSLLTKDQRVINARKSFSINKKVSEYDLYIIIDDLITTGATISTLTNLLQKEQGSVIGIAVAH